MIIYKQEIEDGLSDKIGKSFSFLLPISCGLKEKVLKEKSFSKSSLVDEDLFSMNSILVSTGWNENDVVYSNKEVWKARQTPTHKPLNYEHNGSIIIGHIVESKIVDEENNFISNDSSFDDLPNKFHIYTNSVIYKKYALCKKLEEEVQKLISEIIEGDKWFVSVECLYSDFDYAFMEEDGSTTIVDRNKDTAFLTKHLKYFGGTGEYENKRLGQVLKDFIFSGQGITKKPANPDSVILSSVYDNNINTEIIKMSMTEEEIKEFNKLKEDLSVSTENCKKFELSVSVLKEQLEKASKVADDLESLKSEYSAVTLELSSIKQELKKNERLTLIKNQLSGISEETVSSIFESLSELSDEKFNSHLSSLSSLIKTDVESSTSSVKDEDEEDEDEDDKDLDDLSESLETKQRVGLSSLCKKEEKRDSSLNQLSKEICNYFGVDSKE